MDHLYSIELKSIFKHLVNKHGFHFVHLEKSLIESAMDFLKALIRGTYCVYLFKH